MIKRKKIKNKKEKSKIVGAEKKAKTEKISNIDKIGNPVHLQL
jgi:hypothetical protein